VEAKSVRYPIRLLRYWFGFHLLRVSAEQMGRPVRVAEIGVHTGQMLDFVKAAPGCPSIAKWLAVDAVMLTDKLRDVGYTDFQEANLESPDFALDGEYDVAILLHVLEHLFEPEVALQKIAKNIAPGGVLIGGFPVLPGFLRGHRESRVRRTAKPMGHVSVFSPGRVENMARHCGLDLEFSTGAFLMRSKGSRIENSPLWMRANILWGRMFPGWPGEIYWLMRKPVR
jgi:SAM-dependent methyltransferase